MEVNSTGSTERMREHVLKHSVGNSALTLRQRMKFWKFICGVLLLLYNSTIFTDIMTVLSIELHTCILPNWHSTSLKREVYWFKYFKAHFIFKTMGKLAHPWVCHLSSQKGTCLSRFICQHQQQNCQVIKTCRKIITPSLYYILLKKAHYFSSHENTTYY